MTVQADKRVDGRHGVRARLAAVRRAVARFLRPSARAWRGAALGVALVALLLAGLRAISLGPWPAGFLVWAFLVFTLTAALANLVIDVLLPRLPARYRNLTIGALAVVVWMMLGGVDEPGQFAIAGSLLLGASLLGGGIAVLAGRPSAGRIRPLKAGAAALFGALILVALLRLYRWPGPAVDPATRFAPAAVALPGDNPAARGRYKVDTLYYGSVPERPAYYEESFLGTDPVDGRPFLGNWNGLPGALRSRYWRFGPDNLPLNARVWYPLGDGPFPLVLIVHGNHQMTTPSHAGYAYLAELLASRGMIAVSVDENFLNGAWTDLLPFGENDGLTQENDARAWLLLEHLRQWRDWNAEAGLPFPGKVDLERVALIGHSRGGEAAAIAAAFNRLPHYPDNARVRFDYDFGIRAVVAIAQVDGQYEPGGRATPLEGVSYLALQGAYDGDLTYFDGMRQYNRVDLGDAGDRFKAAIYLDQANHGQFNTEWGRADRTGFPIPGLLNLEPIMDPEAQREIAELFISAFLEATLHGRDDYRVLFQQPGAAAPWLPAVAYRSRYDDGQTRFLATFDEDLDVTTATAPGVTLRGADLAGWKEDMAPLKAGDQGSAALWLRWHGGGRYTLALGDGAPPPGTALSLALAAGDDVGEPLDFTIELVDRAGSTATLPLSSVAPLPPQIPYNPWKHAIFTGRNTGGEPIFQSYLLPLAQFDFEPGFDLAALAAITFVFDRSEEGVIWVDDVGWR